MSITVTELSKEQVKTLANAALVVNRVPPDVLAQLEKDGWYVAYDYSIEKKHKGFSIVIEFCIGDYCVSICSKKNHWLLEKKRSHEDFIMAFVEAQNYVARIDAGEHWQGEED